MFTILTLGVNKRNYYSQMKIGNKDLFLNVLLAYQMEIMQLDLTME